MTSLSTVSISADRRRGAIAVALLVAGASVLAINCGVPRCQEGAVDACACGEGAVGTATCNASGELGACVCPPGIVGASGSSSAASAASGGTSTGSSGAGGQGSGESSAGSGSTADTCSGSCLTNQRCMPDASCCTLHYTCDPHSCIDESDGCGGLLACPEISGGEPWTICGTLHRWSCRPASDFPDTEAKAQGYCATAGKVARYCNIDIGAPPIPADCTINYQGKPPELPAYLFCCKS